MEAFECRSGGAAPPPPAAPAGGLPAGWEEKTDPASGKKYYVNRERKVTQWERPICAMASVDATLQRIERLEAVAKERRRRIQQLELALARLSSASEAEPGSLPKLLGSWVEKTDPAYGRKYYVNHERKVS